MKRLFGLFICLLPWPLKRRLLTWFWGYEIDPGAWIGVAYVFPEKLRMGRGARIGHLTFVGRLRQLEMGECAMIGRLNWITGFPLGNATFFSADAERMPALILGEHSAITNRHLIDCTDRVSIGRFTTFAGFRSQILTHSIDLDECRQRARPVTIGEYCFVGTGCILLGGSALPDRSVLAAGSTLTRAHAEPGMLYAGLPAERKKPIAEDARYFSRPRGFVY